MIWIIDNGHGVNTRGKSFRHNPLEYIREWEFNRELVSLIIFMGQQKGLVFERLVPEDIDISLADRCKRANLFFQDHPDSALISIHGNAGGGTGWEAFTSPGETASDEIATELYRQAGKWLPGVRIRKDYSDGDPDKESRFYILVHTRCPAVLTENFFMDNYSDFKKMMDPAWRNRLAMVHVNAMLKYEKPLKS